NRRLTEDDVLLGRVVREGRRPRDARRSRDLGDGHVVVPALGEELHRGLVNRGEGALTLALAESGHWPASLGGPLFLRHRRRPATSCYGSVGSRATVP